MPRNGGNGNNNDWGSGQLSINGVHGAFGALLSHITGGADARDYQPMNVNFGLFPPFEQRVKKKERKEAYTARAREDFAKWLHPLASKGLQLA